MACLWQRQVGLAAGQVAMRHVRDRPGVIAAVRHLGDKPQRAMAVCAAADLGPRRRSSNATPLLRGNAVIVRARAVFVSAGRHCQ